MEGGGYEGHMTPCACFRAVLLRVAARHRCTQVHLGGPGSPPSGPPLPQPEFSGLCSLPTTLDFDGTILLVLIGC